MRNRPVTPAIRAAARTRALFSRIGDVITISFTPATVAGTAFINTVDG